MFVYSILGGSSSSTIPQIHFHSRLRMLAAVSTADLCSDPVVLETSEGRSSDSVT